MGFGVGVAVGGSGVAEFAAGKESMGWAVGETAACAWAAWSIDGAASPFPNNSDWVVVSVDAGVTVGGVGLVVVIVEAEGSDEAATSLTSTPARGFPVVASVTLPLSVLGLSLTARVL